VEQEAPSILVVDDDQDILMVRRVLLSKKGYLVETATTGKEAIEMSHDRPFNLALLDIVLPDMSGIKLLTLLKETTPRMRKIIVTGHPTMDNAVEGLNRGADAFVVKPVEPRQLLEIVEKQLAAQRDEMATTVKQIEEFIESRDRELQ
jgi:DNA-binding NtrC family response regulator